MCADASDGWPGGWSAGLPNKGIVLPTMGEPTSCLCSQAPHVTSAAAHLPLGQCTVPRHQTCHSPRCPAPPADRVMQSTVANVPSDAIYCCQCTVSRHQTCHSPRCPAPPVDRVMQSTGGLSSALQGVNGSHWLAEWSWVLSDSRAAALGAWTYGLLGHWRHWRHTVQARMHKCNSQEDAGGGHFSGAWPIWALDTDLRSDRAQRGLLVHAWCSTSAEGLCSRKALTQNPWCHSLVQRDLPSTCLKQTQHSLSHACTHASMHTSAHATLPNAEPNVCTSWGSCARTWAWRRSGCVTSAFWLSAPASTRLSRPEGKLLPGTFSRGLGRACMWQHAFCKLPYLKELMGMRFSLGRARSSPGQCVHASPPGLRSSPRQRMHAS